MAKHATGRRGSLEIALAVAVVASGYAVLQGCDDNQTTDEICDNGRDDDGNLAVDCEDIACVDDPACERPADGDADVDGDGDADGDSDVDTDADVDVDADGDGDSDGDAAPDDVCVSEADCQLALDLFDCCGGFPHRVGGDVEVCPTSALVPEVDRNPCLIPWSEGDPMPSVPEECAPFCSGVVCSACVVPTGVLCRGGECAARVDGGCAGPEDDSCPAGFTCTDPEGDGTWGCIEGAHECDTEADCRTAHPECRACTCMDFDADGLRDCDCRECGGDCVSDFSCEPQYFCIDGTCTFAGDDACRTTVAGGDCPPCYRCEPDSPGSERGTCVIDAGPDGGLPMPDAGC